MVTGFSGKYMDDLYLMEQKLRTDKSFDLIIKKAKVARKRATVLH